MAFPGTLQIDYATPYETGTEKQYPYGQRAETPNGDIFRYTELPGTATIANKLYQSAAPLNGHTSQAITVQMDVGDTEISFRSTTANLAANEMAGGTLLAEETADLGHIYRVKSNTVTSTNETICQLEDGVTVLLEILVAGSNVLTFVRNPWRDVIISPAGINTAANAGIPRVIIGANDFGWLQTRGIASCLINTDGQPLLVGNSCHASTSAVGAVSLFDETAAGIDYMMCGYALETAPTADFGHIFLTLE